MPKKRLPTIADSAVLEKVTKERAGTRWGDVVDKVWNEIGGNQEDTVLGEVWGVQGSNKRKGRGEASVNKKGGRRRTVRDMREVKGRDWDENVFVRPNGLRKTLKPQFRVGALDLPGRMKRYTCVVVGRRRRRKMRRGALVAKLKRVKLTLRENVKCTRRNEMCWRRGK